MKNILLTLSYDGTNFCGWQRQDGCQSHPEAMRTVQGEIEKVLEIIHKEKTNLQGSGRTDSGVHAVGQTANFLSPIDSMISERYIPALNSLLPHDIRIHKAQEVPLDFSARSNATSRTYRYFINTSESPYAHQMPYCWPIRRKPDLDKLNDMASFLKGEIDCTTFAASGDLSQSKHRFINDAHFFMQDDNLVFEITANAFLWKMVRSITGTLIEFEGKGKSAKDFQEILLARDRKKAGFTAPAKGLFLWSISYEGKRVHP
ncbi:MAG: tRNA pseudouridine(38-40) synthase TruA [Treponemataceae bacterium]|nr:tRNA pseudouridine(38-40) synthase TruA [Treponemataceae bacterium]